MQVRRVVTGKDGSGKSVFISDGASPREMVLQHTPGFASSPLWRSEGTPDLTVPADHDPMVAGGTMVLGAGGSAFWVITFPPDAVMMSPDWNPALAGPEILEASPGVAERMEPDAPGMHQTPTVDYAVVLKGTLVLELDDGATATLQPGDTVVQQGARHAWRNPTDEPAMLAVVLLGAKT